MKTLSIVSLLVLAGTPALAGGRDPAYAYSGTHAGGPADLLISSTGGLVAPHRPPRVDPAFASHRGRNTEIRRFGYEAVAINGP